MKFIVEPDAKYAGHTYFRPEPPSIDEWVFGASWTGESRVAIARAIWWCRDQFGRSTNGRWQSSGYGIAIRSDADATAFRLRWC